MKINKSKLKVGYVFESSEGGEEIVVCIDKDDGMVYCRHLEEDGNRYKIKNDGSIEV